MTTVRVRETFLTASGSPASGRVVFEPYLMAVDGTPDPGLLVTAVPVVAVLDRAGSIDVALLSSHDDGWQTQDGTMPYRVTVMVGDEAPVTYSALIPPIAGQTESYLHDLIDLGGDIDVVLVPGGPPGPPPTLVDGTTTTLPPGSSATSDVVPTGTLGEYRIDLGIPAGLGLDAIAGSPEPGQTIVVQVDGSLAWDWLSAPPPDDLTHTVLFVTTGATFAPQLELVADATSVVEWLGADDEVLATGLTPTIDFGSAATRTVRMRVSSGADIQVINLGYTYGDDIGLDQVPESYNHPAQAVSAVAGLAGLTGLRYFLAANGNLAGHLDFTGCSKLEFVECFEAYVQRVTLTGCTSLIRLCLERNDLDPAYPLDLNPVAATLRDLRCAISRRGMLALATLTADLAHVYHWCIREQTIVNHPPLDRLPAVVEYWAWGANNAGAASSGAFVLTSDAAYDIRANGSNTGWMTFTDADRQSTGMASTGSLDLRTGQMTSVTLHPASVWRVIDLSGNAGLDTAQVDAIIGVVNGWATGGGVLSLAGCGRPSYSSGAAITALQGRGWTVSTEPLLPAPEGPPVADFTVQPASPSTGQAVTFTDTSTGGAPTSWVWDFGPGATPASASTMGPHSVTYATSGGRAVSLQVGNAGGSSAKSTDLTIADPAAGDLWADTFDRVAGTIAAMGHGWNADGTGAVASTDGADLIRTDAGNYMRLVTPTDVTLPADLGIEVIAPRASWASFAGICVRLDGSTHSGIRAFLQDGTTALIGNALDWHTDNAGLTPIGTVPAGWTAAGDHSLRLEVRGARADVWMDGVQVGYRDLAGATYLNNAPGLQIGICGDGGGGRAYRSIRAYSVS